MSKLSYSYFHKDLNILWSTALSLILFANKMLDFFTSVDAFGYILLCVEYVENISSKLISLTK